MVRKEPNLVSRLSHIIDSDRFTLAFLTSALPLFLLLRQRLEWHIALLVCWNLLAFFWLSMTLMVAFSADAALTRHRMALRKRPLRILVSVIVTAMLSNMSVGLFVSYHSLHHQREVLLCALAILQAWVMMQAAFGRYYGELYYATEPDTGSLHRGLVFHGTEEPTQIDFDYLAFMIALSYSSADVDITRHTMRKLILAHALVSFLFYSTVVTGVLSAVATNN